MNEQALKQRVAIAESYELQALRALAPRLMAEVHEKDETIKDLQAQVEALQARVDRAENDGGT